jgi:hypothetical protein
VNDQPFTAIVCQAGPCAPEGGQLVQRLRAVTRQCPYGVLVSASCLLRAPRCRVTPGHDGGACLIVQPCDLDRKPRGNAIIIGPVFTSADAAAVAQWLSEGGLDAARLEPRLRITPTPGR